jgi:uncharacterized integral membrane protein
MSVLKVFRAILLVVIIVVAIGFTVMNPGERVRVDLFFVPPYENVPLVEALFFAFLLGLLGGLAVAIVRILELQATLRAERRSGSRLRGELTTLRNLPLEDAEERPTTGGGVS